MHQKPTLFLLTESKTQMLRQKTNDSSHVKTKPTFLFDTLLHNIILHESEGTDERHRVEVDFGTDEKQS